MKTTAEIKEMLASAEDWQPWMEAVEADPRKSVQALVASWRRKKEQQQKLLLDLETKLAFDRSFKEEAGDLVCGIDEAGRGPLAGPVVTAAVILPEDCSRLAGLDDSKKLSKTKREELAELIKELAVSYAVHIQPPEKIDELNIYQATKRSMVEAAARLQPTPAVILADAMMLEGGVRCESIIKGDAKSLCIAAASILAKTGRDALMDAYAEEYPVYGFDRHSGYGTKDHVEALRLHGPCPIHRKTFEPVKSILEAEHSLP
ncbi:ribonuclease HII [Planococcus chinensis]|uniref:Ribonuclease HII n=1 Tax=Planococcus chinensis TaxID=272917 RepID=A0ABW4QFS3_9BACL